MSKEIEALEKIAKFPHSGDYGDAIRVIREMKAIATEAIKKFEDSSGKEAGMPYWKQRCEAAERIVNISGIVDCSGFDEWTKLVQSVPPYKEEVDKYRELKESVFATQYPKETDFPKSNNEVDKERAFDKISKNIKRENKEIVDKEIAAINKSK